MLRVFPPQVSVFCVQILGNLECLCIDISVIDASEFSVVFSNVFKCKYTSENVQLSCEFRESSVLSFWVRVLIFWMQVWISAYLGQWQCAALSNRFSHIFYSILWDQDVKYRTHYKKANNNQTHPTGTTALRCTCSTLNRHLNILKACRLPLNSI